MIRPVCVLVLFNFACTAQPARENWTSLNALAPGAGVRVTTTSGKTIRGSFEKVTADAVIVEGAALARGEVRRVELERRRRGRNTLTGLAVGAGIGLAAGAVLDAKAGDDGFAVSAKAVLACAGATVGAIIGIVRPATARQEIYRAP